MREVRVPVWPELAVKPWRIEVGECVSDEIIPCNAPSPATYNRALELLEGMAQQFRDQRNG